MSQYVVHLTKSPEVFAGIVAAGLLRASGPFGFGHFRKMSVVKAQHMSVCFSEVPLDQLGRLTERHGGYGVAFSKAFVRARGGARVWYLDRGSALADSLVQIAQSAAAAGEPHPIWSLTPFMDMVIPGRYEWDWEREWRVLGDLRFDVKDLAFVITPDGVDEFPGLEGLGVDPSFDLQISASPQPLEDYVERLLQEFFDGFEDPLGVLPVEEGAFLWFVDQVSTEDAVFELFPDLSDDVTAQLADYLNFQSPYWVRSSDLAATYHG